MWFDTSSALFALSPEQARAIIDAFGYERFFFGTDHPMWDHQGELARFLALKLPKEAADAIFYQNFERVFGL